MKTTLDDLYERFSFMYGGGWESFENGVVKGDVRVINDIVSQATLVEKKWWPKKNRVMWSSVKPEYLRNVDINEKPDGRLI